MQKFYVSSCLLFYTYLLFSWIGTLSTFFTPRILVVFCCTIDRSIRLLHHSFFHDFTFFWQIGTLSFCFSQSHHFVLLHHMQKLYDSSCLLLRLSSVSRTCTYLALFHSQNNSFWNCICTNLMFLHAEPFHTYLLFTDWYMYLIYPFHSQNICLIHYRQELKRSSEQLFSRMFTSFTDLFFVYPFW